MLKEHIHIVEDDKDIAKLIQVNLSLEGFQTSISYNAEDGLRYIGENEVDLVLLDLMLPGINGIEACKKIRELETIKNTPIIFVTAKGEEKDILKGLNFGADDYIVKPFSPKVLVARVNAVLRRKLTEDQSKEPSRYKYKEISLDTDKHEVLVKDKQIKLTNFEFLILNKLLKKPGWVVSRSQLVNTLHGGEFSVTDRAVDFQMVGLRRKLGEGGDYIETVRGVGYRLKELT